MVIITPNTLASEQYENILFQKNNDACNKKVLTSIKETMSLYMPYLEMVI